MKIISVTHTPNYLNNNIQMYSINRSKSCDTFEKTTSPSFKNKPVQAVKPTIDKVMKVLMCTGGAFAANFFLTLKKDPSGEELMKNPEEAKQAADFASNILYSIIAKADYEENEENIKAPVIEQSEEQPINEGNAAITAEESLDTTIQTTEDESVAEKPFIDFPKKVGRLTANQERLKAVTGNLKLTDDYTYKLVSICQELLTKGKHNIEGEETDNNELSKKIADQLSSEENTKEEIIDKYYEILISKEKPAELINSTTDEIKIKVVGKIDLPDSLQKTLKDEECIANSEFKANDSLSFTFKIPSTNKRYSLHNMLKMLLVQFEKNESESNKDFIKWMYNQSVPAKVYPKDIADEITRQNKKTDKNSTPYKNITLDDAEIIADVINSEERFRNLFSLHGAVRFFERFIDFEGENIERQCKEKLDILELLIRKTEEADGIPVEKYTEKDRKDQYITGSRIILYPQKFGESFVNLLGSFPIIIAICENQSANYYKKQNKQPLIQTIWTIGA